MGLGTSVAIRFIGIFATPTARVTTQFFDKVPPAETLRKTAKVAGRNRKDLDAGDQIAGYRRRLAQGRARPRLGLAIEPTGKV